VTGVVSPRRRSQGRWLVDQLPVGMQEDEFFVRFVSVFQDVADTYVEALDSIPSSMDLSVAPPSFVRWLGTWIGLDAVDAGLPVEVQRAWVRGYGEVLAWRGTRRGLQSLLELLSGGPATVEEGGGVYREDGAPPESPAWVRVRVESTGVLADSDFLRLVLDEVPAHTVLDLRVGDRVLVAGSAP
jgi:phage tail-like protein